MEELGRLYGKSKGEVKSRLVRAGIKIEWRGIGLLK